MPDLDTVQKDSENILKCITPYVASFSFSVSKPGALPKKHHRSCFFIELSGCWLLCTAAHVIDEIEQFVRDGGSISKCYINDGFSQAGVHKSYPFAFLDRKRIRCGNDELGFDYYLILVDDIAVRSLQSQGLRAFPRHQIGIPSEADKWVLTGFPSQYVKEEGRLLRSGHVLIGAKEIDRPVEDGGAGEYKLFGQLDDISGFSPEPLDIGGMSGGPVFGIYDKKNGSVDVKLIAVQSGWLKDQKVITICPMEVFLRACDPIFTSPDASLLSEGN